METSKFLTQHGYAVVFLWVLAEQLGVPIPSIPVLLAAGALTATGEIKLLWALVLVVTAAIIADAAWYYLGRRKGMKVLNFLCRISLEPDSCVSKTELSFSKQGIRSLIFAKFIPGLSTAAPPLAGVFAMRLRKFIFFDGLGALLWAGVFLGAGRLFSQQIDSIADRAIQLGGSFFTVIIFILAVYIGWKFLQRQLFIRELRIARVAPEELKQLIDAGEQVMIVDLRHALDFASNPELVAGALRISPDELEARHNEIPRDRDIILYCT